MARSNAASPQVLDVTTVRTSLLARYCDPYKGCWIDLEDPITIDEVSAGLGSAPRRPPRPYETWWSAPNTKAAVAKVRRDHIRRIAWFVKNGFQDPIDVDVGVPSLGYYNTHLIVDGNHRFAAALYRMRVLGEDPVLPVALSGSLEHARELGFQLG